MIRQIYKDAYVARYKPCEHAAARLAGLQAVAAHVRTDSDERAAGASAVAQALRAADWGGVSIGNKALIAAAISELEAIPAPATPPDRVTGPALPPSGSSPACWRIDVDCALQGLRDTAQQLPDQHTAQNPIAAAAGILQAVASHGYGVAPATPPGVRALKEALADLTDAFLSRHGCFPLDQTNDDQRHWRRAMSRAYELVGQPNTPQREALLDAHPAGQSTRQEAFGAALERFDAHRLAISQRGPSAKRDGLLSELDTIRNSMCRAIKPAPDSPLTGPVDEPCAWAGGNDTCYCRTCGEEYRYGREDKPACPRKPAPSSGQG